MKSPQLGTKIACTYLFTCITHHLGKEIMPLAGKIMFSLVNGLLDRNAAVRKHCADTLGSLVGCSKVCKSHICSVNLLIISTKICEY